MSGLQKIRVCVIGASGYTGADAVRLLLGHEGVEIAALTGHAHAGEAYGDVFGHFAISSLPDLCQVSEVDWRDIDAVICGLPHGTAQDVIAGLPGHVKIIDMSADFRFRDIATYAATYGRKHCAPDLNAEAVYGLSEHFHDKIAKARLVACPGCYPTAVLLALLPVLKAGLIAPEDIIIDAKSGVTGAGRSLKEQNLFSEIAEGCHAYSVAGHRHTPEIETILGDALNMETGAMRVNFTPHLVPMNRGELVSIYARVRGKNKAADIRACLGEVYGDADFVHLCADTVSPQTRHVRGSNHCLLNAFDDRLEGRVILFAAIDNLVKGSSGQAIQNLNIMFGFPQVQALMQMPLCP